MLGPRTLVQMRHTDKIRISGLAPGLSIPCCYAIPMAESLFYVLENFYSIFL